MGKLFIRLIIFFSFIQLALSQDTLCVYKTTGTSLVELNSKKITLQKGGILTKKSIVTVLSNSEFTAIDNKGNTYVVNIEGKYSLLDLLNFKVTQEQSNFTAAYFKHVWDDLTNQGNNETRIAGVFRGESLMVFPKDKSKIANSKLLFKWDVMSNSNLYYLFLKNTSNNEILKIETNGSQLALYEDNLIFNEGDFFEWAISTDAFPSLDNIPFFGFQLIDRNTYETEKSEYSGFINDLKTLGHSEKEIELILCKTYGLCK